MTKSIRLSSVAAAITCVLAVSLQAVESKPSEAKPPEGSAQALPGADRYGTDPLHLLKVAKVQKELNLTEDQIKKIDKISDEVDAEAAKKAASVKKSDAEAKDFESHISDARDKVKKVLNEKQVERFKEILLQAQGASALQDKEVAEQLKITPQQEEKLRGIAKKTDEKARGAYEKVRGSGPDAKKALDANASNLDSIFQESSSEVTSALTPEQKSKLEKMRGAKFTLDRKDVSK